MESKPELTLAIIEDLKAKGYSQSEIARMYGVTRQAVSWHKKMYGGKTTPREEALKHFPWQVKAEQAHQSPYRHMRDHAEYMATGGVGMSARKLQGLRTFYRYLKEEPGWVLEFDPSLPPVPGISNKGGFAYRHRRPSDGDLIIRVNEHTTLTDEGRLIWRLPPVEP